MDKWFLNPATGKTVKYPEHFAQLKPYLIEVGENPICEDCMIGPEKDAPGTKEDEKPAAVTKRNTSK